MILNPAGIFILKVCRNISAVLTLVILYESTQIEPSAFELAMGTDPRQTYIKIAMASAGLMLFAWLAAYLFERNYKHYISKAKNAPPK